MIGQPASARGQFVRRFLRFRARAARPEASEPRVLRCGSSHYSLEPVGQRGDRFLLAYVWRVARGGPN